jgi:tetratricopeptide (TPR) repeat protein
MIGVDHQPESERIQDRVMANLANCMADNRPRSFMIDPFMRFWPSEVVYSNVQYYFKLIKSKVKLESNKHLDVANALNEVRYAYHLLGQIENENKFALASLSMFKRIHATNDHPDVAQALRNASLACHLSGEFENQLRFSLESLEMCDRLYMGDHVTVAACLRNVAQAFKSNGDVQNQLKYSMESFEMYERLNASNEVARCLSDVGEAYKTLGNKEESLNYFFKSLEMYRIFLPVDCAINNSFDSLPKPKPGINDHLNIPSEVARCLGNVGEVYEALGNKKKSLSFFLQSLEVYKKLKPVDCEETEKALEHVAKAYFNMNDMENGQKYQQECEEIRKRSNTTNDLNYLNDVLNMTRSKACSIS